MDAFIGYPHVGRQGQKARDLAAQRDVNTLPDPRTYAFVSGLLGQTPDEQGFSVLHPKKPELRQSGDTGYALGLLAQFAPVTKGMPVGASIKPEVLSKALDTLKAFERGESPPAVLKGGLLTTADQRQDLNAAFSELTKGKQPPYERNAMNINLGHIYDSRVSGMVKPNGKRADSFTPEEVVSWLAVAGDDSAKVRTNLRGQPHLENLYTDPVTGESYKVRLPISAAQETGKQWVSGLVPEGKFSGPKKKP